MVHRSWRKLFAGLSVSALSAVAVTSTGFPIRAAEPAPTPVAPAIYTFGTLRALKADDAKAKSESYLKSVGKFEATAFGKVWANEGRSILDRTVDSLAMANPDVTALIKAAKNPDLDAPAELPKFLADEKADPFFKANVATAYAKALSSKRVYEEALDALKTVLPEQVVDPATYYFYKAVTEHSLIQKEQAVASIVRLLDDVADAPDRYKMVATLMFFDMQNWSADAKDLSNIGRLMDNSGRRLDLARGGQKTQDIQKKIVFRLDEKIKELENQAKGKGSGNGGSCPDGKGDQQGSQPNQGNNPAQDGYVGGVPGEGKVDDKKLKKLAEEWGKLPAAERAKAITEITRDLPPKFKPMIEEYFKSLNKLHNVQP